MAYVLLGVALVAGLLLIPFGWPGAWLQLAAVALFAWRTEFTRIGVMPLAVLLVVTASAELIQAVVAGGRLDRGVTRRIGFAAVLGGGAGAALGLTFPLLGSFYGSVGGALVGAMLGSIRMPRQRPGTAGVGAHMVALAFKVAAGFVIGFFTLLSLRV